MHIGPRHVVTLVLALALLAPAVGSAQLLPDSGGPLFSTTLHAPSGDWFVTGEVRGTPGTLVEVHAGDRMSAPIRVDGAWQRFGVRGSSGEGLLAVTLRPAGAVAGPVEVRDVAVTASGPTMMSVRPGTRIIERNGQPWVGKGFVYLAYAIGDTWPPSTMTSLDNPAACQQDARLLAAAGVTSLRGYLQDSAMVNVDAHLQCMDAFAANGIGAAWIVYGLQETTAQNPDDTTLVETYWAKIARFIELYGDHPMTEFWMFGNEVEHQSGQAQARRMLGTQGGNVGLFDELFRRTKAADPHHLVGTSVSLLVPRQMADTNLPHLDVWGLNLYPRPGVQLAAGSPIMDQVQAWDERPKLLTELGTDRLRCARDFDSYINEELAILLNARPPWRVRLCAEGSGDDAASHQAQADWNSALWDDVALHLATPSNPDGHFVGAHFFMWSDVWWGSLLGALDPYDTPVTHGVNGWGPFGGMFDGIFNAEYAGASYAQRRTATEPRVTTVTIDALARRWRTTTPPPTMPSGPDLTVTLRPNNSCIVQVSWTTSRAATTEVQRALDGAVRVDGALASDDTVYEEVVNKGELTTTHTAVDYVPISPVPFRWVARSFTADGAMVTAPPLVGTCG